jgi:cystathionine gamma-synthase
MDIPEAERIARGITNNLLRFSVGLEHVEDLKADLRQAFEQLK